jgi:hypothetical protein
MPLLFSKKGECREEPFIKGVGVPLIGLLWTWVCSAIADSPGEFTGEFLDQFRVFITQVISLGWIIV